MAPPDPDTGPGTPADPAERPDGGPATADFTGLAAGDRGAAAPVATFEDLDDTEPPAQVRPDLLGWDTADAPPAPRTVDLDDLDDRGVPDGGHRDDGASGVRVASFDGRPARVERPRADRPSRPRPEGSRADRRRTQRSPAPPRRGDAPDDRGVEDLAAAAPEPDTDGSRDTRARRGRGTRTGGSSGGGGLSFSPPDDEARAKEICLRLLTDRARTVQELAQALRRKEIPDEVARRVLERFDEVGLVDDEAFAGQWVRSRHRQRGLGRRAIAAELHRKGVAKEVADEALTEIDAESERSRARELVDRKLRTVPVATKEQRITAARRLVGMLARKGYGGGVAYGVVREAIAAHGAETDELGEGPLDE